MCAVCGRWILPRELRVRLLVHLRLVARLKGIDDLACVFCVESQVSMGPAAVTIGEVNGRTQCSSRAVGIASALS